MPTQEKAYEKEDRKREEKKAAKQEANAKKTLQPDFIWYSFVMFWNILWYPVIICIKAK